MPWDELRAAQQRYRRAAKAVQRGDAIGKRYCLVCLHRLIWGERTTRRFCSDRCRQKAHRLRGAGRWQRQLKLHALHQRCLDRLVLASRFDGLKDHFNILLRVGQQLGARVPMTDKYAADMVRAGHEQKRAEATERTMVRVHRRVRS
jgi:hypothetical protein